MEDILLVKMLITDNIICDVYCNTSNKKYCIIHSQNDIRGDLYEYANSNEDVVTLTINNACKIMGKDVGYYKIIQNPYKEIVKRKYGKTPYYLNNGIQINIRWFGDIPNPSYKVFDDVPINTTIDRFLNYQVITSDKDDLGVSYMISSNTYSYTASDTSKVKQKIVYLVLPNMKEQFDETIDGDFKKTATNSMVYGEGVYDSSIIKDTINTIKKNVMNVYKLSDYPLTLCNPDTEPCDKAEEIKYYPPFMTATLSSYTNDQNEIDNISYSTSSVSAPTVSNANLRLFFDRIDESTPIVVKAKSTIDVFDVTLGEAIRIDNSGLLADEYVENDYKGEDEVFNDVNNSHIASDDITEEDINIGISETKSASFTGNCENTSNATKKTEILKSAMNNTYIALPKRGDGHCPVGVYNHAYRYVHISLNKSLPNSRLSSGGNANSQIYRSFLQKLGYTILKPYKNISKNELKNIIKSADWAIGDVAIYWSSDGDADDHAHIYGHTQMWTGGAYSSKSNWATDDSLNYGGAFFVYGNTDKHKGTVWNLYILKAPTFN